MRLNDPAGARPLWRELAQMPRYHTDLRLRLLLFDMALRLDDEAGMEKGLADIRAVERSEGTFSLYGQALRLLWQAEVKKTNVGPALAQAKEHLAKVMVQRPNWPAVHLARSRVHKLEGNPEKAIAELREALNHGETSPDVIQQLAALLTDRGRHQEAEQEMSKLREPLLAGDPDLGRLATLVALRKGDLRTAVATVDTLVKPDTTDFRKLLFRARVLAEAKKVEEAEKAFARAIELAPAEPVVWVARVQFLAAQKKREDEVQQVIDQAAAKLPPEKKALTLGQCYEVLGKQKEAAEAYKKALNDRPNDVAVVRAAANFHLMAGRVREAEPLLREITSGAVKEATEADREWARHGRALALAADNDYDHFREALHLEGLDLDDRGQLVRHRNQDTSIEQQKSQARVLATQIGQRQFRKRAIELLEGLHRNQALLPNDRYILALLYEADGKWNDARQILEDLVKMRPVSPQYLARLAQSLLQHGDLVQAEERIDQLKKLEEDRRVEANTFASVEMRARLEETRGNGDKALTRLQEHVSRKTEHPPEEVLLVIDSYRRQKRWAEAYSECEKMWDQKKCKPEVCGGVSVAILRGMTPTDGQAQRLEKRLREACTQNPQSMVLLLHLADLYDLRGRYRDAETLYRQILDAKNEPKNVVALNNLAWLLAHREGGAPEALGYIEKAVSGLGRRADLLDTRGLVYLKLGKREAALADLKEASEEAPTPTRLFHLAKAYHESRDRAAALGALDKAHKSLEQVKKPLPAVMHPTEQEECRRLLAELKVP
jgi:Tfp pilus assembly protein PilF